MIGSKIFIDTTPFIYALEDNISFSESVRHALSEYFMEGIPLCISLLTFTEYCVVPFRLNEIRKISDFEAFIADANIDVVPRTKHIAKYVSQLRAKYSGIKAMDALQLASAIQNHCDVFLTNGKQLRQVEEIKVFLVEEL